MAKEYRLSIIVTGKDNGAKSMLGGVGSALGAMGKIAGGILAADLLKKIGDGLKWMATTAYDSVAAFQKMEMGLISLQARELKNSGELERLNGYATENLHLTQTQACGPK